MFAFVCQISAKEMQKFGFLNLILVYLGQDQFSNFLLLFLATQFKELH